MFSLCFLLKYFFNKRGIFFFSVCVQFCMYASFSRVFTKYYAFADKIRGPSFNFDRKNSTYYFAKITFPFPFIRGKRALLYICF